VLFVCHSIIEQVPQLKELWPLSGGLLRRAGYPSVRGKGLVDFYYLRPGVTGAHLQNERYRENVYFFTTQNAMYKYVCDHWEGGAWRQLVPPLTGLPIQVSLTEALLHSCCNNGFCVL
jgi:hypothetical protein